MTDVPGGVGVGKSGAELEERRITPVGCKPGSEGTRIGCTASARTGDALGKITSDRSFGADQVSGTQAIIDAQFIHHSSVIAIRAAAIAKAKSQRGTERTAAVVYTTTGGLVITTQVRLRKILIVSSGVIDVVTPIRQLRLIGQGSAESHREIAFARIVDCAISKRGIAVVSPRERSGQAQATGEAAGHIFKPRQAHCARSHETRWPATWAALSEIPAKTAKSVWNIARAAEFRIKINSAQRSPGRKTIYGRSIVLRRGR